MHGSFLRSTHVEGFWGYFLGSASSQCGDMPGVSAQPHPDHTVLRTLIDTESPHLNRCKHLSCFILTSDTFSCSHQCVCLKKHLELNPHMHPATTKATEAAWLRSRAPHPHAACAGWCSGEQNFPLGPTRASALHTSAVSHRRFLSPSGKGDSG